jgi:hypothetical protein
MKKEGIAGSQDVEGYATHAGEGISALVDGKVVEVNQGYRCHCPAAYARELILMT